MVDLYFKDGVAKKIFNKVYGLTHDTAYISTTTSTNTNNNIDMSYLEANEFGAEHMNLDLEAMLARGTLVDSPSLKKLDHWQGSNTQLAYIK